MFISFIFVVVVFFHWRLFNLELLFHNLLLSRIPWEPTVLLVWLQEIHVVVLSTVPAQLFVQITQQSFKIVLEGVFYLCVYSHQIVPSYSPICISPLLVSNLKINSYVYCQLRVLLTTTQSLTVFKTF